MNREFNRISMIASIMFIKKMGWKIFQPIENKQYFLRAN